MLDSVDYALPLGLTTHTALICVSIDSTTHHPTNQVQYLMVYSQRF